MNIVSFGGGVNSAAMLVGMYQRSIPIDLKEEVHRPFAQEQELTAKTQRLNVLRLALNMDKGGTGRERPQPEQAEEKPSIRGMLKRLEAEAAAVNNAPQGRYDREVAI